MGRLANLYLLKRFQGVPVSEWLAAVALWGGVIGGSTWVDGAGVDSSNLVDPPFLLGERPLSASDRGTAVHLFLEHVDFSQAPGEESLRAQLQKLVERKIISQGQVEAINFEDVLWLLNSQVGKLLRKYSA